MELYWDNASEKTYTGVITAISHMNEEQKEGSDKKVYRAYASFEPDERIRLGMTMLIYPAEKTEDTGTPAEEDTEAPAEGETEIPITEKTEEPEE